MCWLRGRARGMGELRRQGRVCKLVKQKELKDLTSINFEGIGGGVGGLAPECGRDDASSPQQRKSR